MTRTLLVSNRLPVSVLNGESGLELKPSVGGLATGMRGGHERGESVWIGWDGQANPACGTSAALAEEFRRLRLRPVELDESEIACYYAGVSNRVLWPLFHYQIDRLPLDDGGWDVYRAVNQKFADRVIEEFRAGDTIWVHDYQLLLVPAMVRERLPHARIGLFLHIPFPSSEVFGLLPQREEVLNGMLGADLIGFHTSSYVRHFRTALTQWLGISVSAGGVPWAGRTVEAGAFPLGVDASELRRRADGAKEVPGFVPARPGASDQRWMLSVDRLDYTKGILRRLLALERLLHTHPEWSGRVTLVQVTAPSRENVDGYAAFHAEIDQMVGRINSLWATTDWRPIVHVHRALSSDELSYLYRSVDVMVVTPIRDGMNLVAKEFVASRADDTGVLVLSEFAGAASDLAGAILVNPYDIGGTAEALHTALELGPEETAGRMERMRGQVNTHTAEAWAEKFLAALQAPIAPSLTALPPPLPSNPPVLLLDFDGTLVPFNKAPDAVRADDALRALLAELCLAGVDLRIVSGRPREFLDRELGLLPATLYAEHGAWHRAPGGTWRSVVTDERLSKERLRPHFAHVLQVTPGSLLEEKSGGFAWHYRGVPPAGVAGAEKNAREFYLLLKDILHGTGMRVVRGSSVVETTPSAGSKARAVEALAGCARTIIAIGDDETDEEMFRALPADGVSVHVGPGHSMATYRLENCDAVRAYLGALVQSVGASGGARLVAGLT